jgi:hypothetical protein
MRLRDLHTQALAKKRTPIVEAVLWPCEHCGKLAEIEAVEPSLDRQRMLTYWHCPPCQTWGVTPDIIRQPPVWVSKREQ